MGYKIQLYDSSGHLIRGVSQWDVNRVIKIRGLNLQDAPVIRLYNALSETATSVETSIVEHDVVFTIPNEFTSVALDIRVSVVSTNVSEYMTICKFIIPVSAQTKPDNYDELIDTDGNTDDVNA